MTVFQAMKGELVSNIGAPVVSFPPALMNLEPIGSVQSPQLGSHSPSWLRHSWLKGSFLSISQSAWSLEIGRQGWK